MSFGFANPLWLFLLPLAILPWLKSGLKQISLPSFGAVPRDLLSTFLAFLIRLLASVAFAALVIAIAKPETPPHAMTRTGQGAQVVLLLDRSRSMDQPFRAAVNGRGVPALARSSVGATKSEVARRVLADFITARKNDRFGMLAFSTRPIEVLPLTDKQPMVLAAIEAGSVGRGLAETNIGNGLMQAMDFFRGQEYTGSRIIVLISDGAASITLGDKQRIEAALERYRISLYWIYIRSPLSVGLHDETSSAELAPEQQWHTFFSEMETPYKVYTAEEPEDLRRAIEDVGRLQTMPLLYEDIQPAVDYSQLFYRIAAFALILLTLLRATEIRQWR